MPHIKNGRYVGNPTQRRAFDLLDLSEPILRASLRYRMLLFGHGGLDQLLTDVGPSEAIMNACRTERARARARDVLSQIAPLPNDSEVQRLRELSMDYIREAERLELTRFTSLSPASKFPQP